MSEEFEGFGPPIENWSKLPHQFIDALPLIETIAEMKVILYVLRHTWGFQDDKKRITGDEFAEGRKTKDGTRLDNGTGLSKPSIRDGIKRAIEHGFLIVETDDSDKARIKKYYSLNQLGVKVLPPGGKSFTPRGKDSYPRTEKETLETNLKKVGSVEKQTEPAPPQETSKRKREPTARDIRLNSFKKTFLQETGLPWAMNKPEERDFWGQISLIDKLAQENADQGCYLIAEAVRRLRADNLTISSPRSLVKTARAIIGEQVNRRANAREESPDDTTIQQYRELEKLYNPTNVKGE
jgi:hypothetical protein